MGGTGRRWWRGLARWVLPVVATLIAVEYGVLPALVAARQDGHLVRDASWLLVALALVLELASIASMTGVSLTVLPAEARPRPVRQLAADVVGFGGSHVLPGGSATAMALRGRLMTESGVPVDTVVAATAVGGAVSVLVLLSCYGLGVLSALPSLGPHPVLVLTAVLGTFGVVGTALLLAVLAGREAPEQGERRAVRTRFGAWLLGHWLAARDDAVAFVRDGRRFRRATAWSAANWLLDAGALWVCLAAYHRPPWFGGVLVCYGFVSLLALLPITPGGLGLVEGTLIPLLAGFGATLSQAVLGVLTWRLLQFWFPVLLAAAAYAGLWLDAVLRGRTSDRAGGALRPSTDTGAPGEPAAVGREHEEEP